MNFIVVVLVGNLDILSLGQIERYRGFWFVERVYLTFRLVLLKVLLLIILHRFSQREYWKWV